MESGVLLFAFSIRLHTDVQPIFKSWEPVV